jgi:tryptophanyl-tRNA synthetase
MSLKDPVRKMSKSDADPYSRILLTDTREDIRKKIRMALTDSELSITYDPDRRPGVSNLIEILSHVDPDGRSCHEVATSFESVGIKALKDQVATALGDYLEAIRERYFDIMGKDANYFEDIAEKGASKARAHADVTMKSVKSAMGLL